MEISLEKVELVRDRTGVSYSEAKDALEKADGSVVDAIIAIEEKLNVEYDSVSGESLKDSPIFYKMKEIVSKGNISRIVIKNGDMKIISFPVTVGVVGAALVPWAAVLGAIAAVGTKCRILFVDDKGVTMDMNGKVVEVADKAKNIAEKGLEKVNEYVNKETVSEAYDKAKEVAGKAVEKGQELYKEAMDKAEEYKVKEKVEDFIDKVGVAGEKINAVKAESAAETPAKEEPVAEDK